MIKLATTCFFMIFTSFVGFFAVDVIAGSEFEKIFQLFFHNLPIPQVHKPKTTTSMVTAMA